MLPGLRRRASGHRHLLTGSAALVLTAACRPSPGALFWLIAARVDTQTDVGHATALFTSVLFVAFVAGLGQPVAAARYAAGRTRDDHVLFAWGALATVVASHGRRPRLPRSSSARRRWTSCATGTAPSAPRCSSSSASAPPCRCSSTCG